MKFSKIFIALTLVLVMAFFAVSCDLSDLVTEIEHSAGEGDEPSKDTIGDAYGDTEADETEADETDTEGSKEPTPLETTVNTTYPGNSNPGTSSGTNSGSNRPNGGSGTEGNRPDFGNTEAPVPDDEYPVHSEPAESSPSDENFVDSEPEYGSDNNDDKPYESEPEYDSDNDTPVCPICVDEEDGIKDGVCDVCGNPVEHAKVDTTFEEIAKEYLATQGPIAVKQVSDTNIYGLGIPMRNEQVIIQKRDAFGSIYQLQQSNTYIAWDYVTESLYLSSDVCVIQIGYDFYVTSTQTEETTTQTSKIFVSGTASEIENLEGQLTQDVNVELAYSVNHFRAGNVSYDADGNTVYTCYGLREESAEAYNQLCANMMAAAGQSVSFSMDPDSFCYVITVDANGRIVFADLSMNISAYVQGMYITYVMSAEQVYEYEVEPVVAPAVNNQWIGMTLTEYFGLAQNNPCSYYEHYDDNANGFCDKCGTQVGFVPHLGECTDGDDSYHGYCDHCFGVMN